MKQRISDGWMRAGLNRFSTGLLGLCLALAWAVSGEEAPPNILLIISDDHAWTDYSFMGHADIQTPHLDRLAEQSLVFPHGYVPASLCCPSLASIITGLYPHQHKVTCNDPPMPPGMKPAEFYKSAEFRDGREVMTRHLEAVPTLPRLLQGRGYASLQTGKWWQGEYQRGGFTAGMTRGGRHGDEGLKIGRQTMQPIYEFIEGSRREGKPFFVWYAPMLPHDPHNPPERLLAKYREKTNSIHVARYWAMVEWFDETCGALLNYLEREKLSESTLVIYVTDNGWIQDPGAGRFGPKSKQSPYDGGLRTPLMIRWPGKVAPARSEALAMSIDIAPTVLTAIGVQPPAGMAGINLLDPEAVAERPRIFGECFVHTAVDLNDPARNLRWRWVREGRWKLIVPQDASAPAELYDIMADPHEMTNRLPAEGKLADGLRGKLDAWWPGK